MYKIAVNIDKLHDPEFNFYFMLIKNHINSLTQDKIKAQEKRSKALKGR